MSTGDSVPFNARSSLFFLTPVHSLVASRSCDVSLRRISADVQPSPPCSIRVLSFVCFLFSHRLSHSRSGRSARFFVSLYSFRALFIGFICVADGIYKKAGLPSLTLPFCFSFLLSLCLSSLQLFYLRFLPFPSFFLCFFSLLPILRVSAL